MNLVTIMYPQGENTHFDMEYYTATHMPMFADAMGDNCKSWGASAAQGDDFHCIAWAVFEDMDGFNGAMAEHGKAIMADVAKFTNARPQMVFGEITAQSSDS